MGHRMKIYSDKSISDEKISASQSLGVPAESVGSIEKSEKKELSSETGWGNYQL